LIELILYLALMLLTAETFGWIFSRIDQPVVLGQIVGGILLGLAFPPTEEVKDISMIGVLMLLFLAGLESSVDELKGAGKSGFSVAVVGVVVAFAFGFAIAYPFKGFDQALLYGALTTPTSVSLTVRVLMEMDRLKSREGTTILTAAIVDDILGIIVLTIVISSLISGGVSVVSLAEILVKVGLFIALMVFAMPRVLDYALRKVVRIGFTDSTVTLSMAALFLFAYLAEHMNLASILGAYLLGLALSETEFRKPIFEHSRVIAHSVFVPLFFVDVGMNIPIKDLSSAGVFAVMFSLVAIASKIVGCGLGAILGGMRGREALRVGVGMVPRMGVELAMLAIAMKAGIVGSDAYLVIVLMIFLSTLVTPPLLKLAFREGKGSESTT